MQLEAAYVSEVNKLKVCKPELSKLQCTETLGSDLLCDCQTYINPDNQAALAAANKLAQQYKLQGCIPGVACKCAQPKGAMCVADASTGGTCKDAF